MKTIKPRVIPCLSLGETGLVKTVRFREPTYVGDPINAVKIFNESEVDELIVLDLVASKKERAPDFAKIEELASECFMPLCYVGGVTHLAQAEKLFSLGIEKVGLNHVLYENSRLLTEVANVYGSQSVVAGVDIKKSFFGRHEVFSHVLGKTMKLSWLEWLKRLESDGAGEVLLNFVDLDGTLKGYDLEAIAAASEAVRIPLIVLGGAGQLQDFPKAIAAGASAVSAGSLFVFHGRFRAVLINYPTQAELAQLFSPT